jgi:tetratricopeptide (TPR) repeat protein
MSRTDSLIDRDTLESLGETDALQAIGELVDFAHDRDAPGLTDKALRWADELERRGLAVENRVRLDYFRANAFANRYRTRLRNRPAAWAWDQPELQQQIFFLRRARYNTAFADLSWFNRCQILTNLANVLDMVGRFIEARSVYSQALAIEPAFWMASGNRGVAAIHYGRAVFDPGH